MMMLYCSNRIYVYNKFRLLFLKGVVTLYQELMSQNDFKKSNHVPYFINQALYSMPYFNPVSQQSNQLISGD